MKECKQCKKFKSCNGDLVKVEEAGLYLCFEQKQPEESEAK